MSARGTFRQRVACLIDPNYRRFEGAGAGRRFDGTAHFGRVNSEVGASAHTLAARSSHLAVNNPLIANAVGNIVAEAVGSGIRPAPRHADQAMRSILMARFDRWAEVGDADQRTNFDGMQAAMVQDVVVRGESFALFIETPGGPRLRQLDVEQVDRSLTRVLANGAQIVQGVEFDAVGQRIAYHISPARLADTFATWAPPVRVPADRVLHVFRPLFPGQVRGVPWTASIILGAGELDKLIDALLMSASVSAMFAGVITDEGDLSGNGDPFDGEAQPSLEPGTLIRLKGGQKVTFATPQQFTAAAETVKIQIRSLAAGLGVPSFMVDGDLTGANYSSLRAGLLPFRRRIEQFQYHQLAPQLLNPVWRRVIGGEILAGTIAESDVPPCDWIVPKPLQVDPLKDVAADAKEIEAGLASRRQKVAERGWNLDDLDAEIADDVARQAALNPSTESTAQ